MRSYMEKNEPTVWWIKPLKIATVILASIAAMMLLTLICSLIILNSKLPESSESVMMTIVSAVTSILMSALLTLKSKAILSALFAFAVMFVLKLILTNIMAHGITFGRQGIVGIIFTAVFCIIGSLIGANIKK